MAEEKLRGIGGWLLVYLILIILSIIISLIIIIPSIIIRMSPSFNELMQSWLSNTIPSPGEIVFYVVALLFNIAILVFVLRKKQNGPKWIITMVWVGFVLGLIRLIVYAIPKAINLGTDLYNASNLGSSNVSSFLNSSAGVAFPMIFSSVFGLTVGLAFNIIVTLYFKRSKRVKNTFVN